MFHYGKLNSKTMILIILVAVLVGYFPIKTAINKFLSGRELAGKKKRLPAIQRNLRKQLFFQP